MNTMISKTSGRVRVNVGADYDEWNDCSEYGVWTDKVDWNDSVYSQSADAVRLAKSDLWRDRRGRIVSAPEGGDGRDYDTIKLSDNYAGESHALKYYFQDADRLVALNRNDWAPMVIMATVTIDGREVGSAAVGGYESDDTAYMESEARNIAHEAIQDARAFVKSLC